MKKTRKWLSVFFISIISILLFVATLEVSYRNYLFDFYKADFLLLNKEFTEGKKNILICGDSFSACKNSYVEIIRDSLNEYNVINTSIPGTGILQHAIYLPDRIKTTKPDIFIYQFYIGNDLFDIIHPHHSKEISVIRKLYWMTSDKILSLPYLNQKLAGINVKVYNDNNAINTKNYEAFDVSNYSPREKFNFKADPYLIENTLYLEKEKIKAWEIFKTKLKKISSMLPSNCKKYFLIIPYFGQTSEVNFENSKLIGSKYNHNVFTEENFPLYNNLKEICNEEDFKLINVLSEFKNNDSIYYSNDPHLNDLGNKLVANIILELLKSENIK